MDTEQGIRSRDPNGGPLSAGPKVDPLASPGNEEKGQSQETRCGTERSKRSYKEPHTYTQIIDKKTCACDENMHVCLAGSIQ